MTTPADRPPCSRCGQVHARCIGHSKRHKGPCGAHPMTGQDVCATHGGKSPQAIAAAERRQLVAAADRAMQDLWVGLDQATPITDPVASLQKLAGALEQLVDETGRRVSTMDHLAGGQHLTALRGEVVLFERALARLADVLDKMARHGIADRLAKVEEQQAAVITAAYRGADNRREQLLLDLVAQRREGAALVRILEVVLPEVRAGAAERFLELLGAGEIGGAA